VLPKRFCSCRFPFYFAPRCWRFASRPNDSLRMVPSGFFASLNLCLLYLFSWTFILSLFFVFPFQAFTPWPRVLKGQSVVSFFYARSWGFRLLFPFFDYEQVFPWPFTFPPTRCPALPCLIFPSDGRVPIPRVLPQCGLVVRASEFRREEMAAGHCRRIPGSGVSFLAVFIAHMFFRIFRPST